MSSRQTRKQKKPQLLAYGRAAGYGDIHYPTLPCKESHRTPQPPEDYISKSMSRSEALAEIRKTSPLRQRKFDFVIVPEEFCEGEGKLRVGKGSNRTSLSQNRYLLISKYGGKTVRQTSHELIQQAKRITKYLRALYTLRDNVALMNKENYYHRDITDANMTYDEEKGKAFLIDFEHTDRSPVKNSPRSSGSTNLRNSNDETQFVENAIFYLEDELQTLGLLGGKKASSPPSSRKTSSRTRKIIRRHSM